MSGGVAFFGHFAAKVLELVGFAGVAETRLCAAPGLRFCVVGAVVEGPDAVVALVEGGVEEAGAPGVEDGDLARVAVGADGVRVVGSGGNGGTCICGDGVGVGAEVCGLRAEAVNVVLEGLGAVVRVCIAAAA